MKIKSTIFHECLYLICPSLSYSLINFIVFNTFFYSKQLDLTISYFTRPTSLWVFHVYSHVFCLHVFRFALFYIFVKLAQIQSKVVVDRLASPVIHAFCKALAKFVNLKRFVNKSLQFYLAI